MDNSIDLLIEVPNHPPILQVSPASLSDLISKLSSSILKPASSISVLYNRRGTFFKIADNETYTSVIAKAINQKLDEISLKVEFLSAPEDEWDLVSAINQTVTEEFKLEESKFELEPAPTTSNPFGLNYRYLNGPDHQRFKGLELENLDLLLSDLASLIVKNEHLDSATMTCAFYTEDGSPVTGTLSQMNFVKAESVLKFGARVCLYIVPNFDIKSAEKLVPQGKDLITVADKKDVNVSHSLYIDLNTATVLNLKQNLYYLTNIPTYKIVLKLPDAFLARNEAMLSEYGITTSSQLSYELRDVDYSAFTYKKYSIQSIAQSQDGLVKLHSFLHTFSKHAEINEKPVRESFLGYVRQFTYNDSAFVSALFHLSKIGNISLLTSIALEEGSILLSKTVTREVFKETVEDSKLLEHIIDVFGLLCDLSCNPQEELSRGEVYTTFNIDCPLTLDAVKDPVLIRRTDGKSLYYEHSEVVKKIKADEEIKSVGKLTESELKIDENFRYVSRRGELNSYSEVFIWEGVFDTTKSIGQLVSEKHQNGITLTKAVELKRAYILTKPIPPLSLKKSEFKDCMTYDKNNNLVIFFSLNNKEANKVDLMNILTRTLVTIDIDDLASAIEMRNPTEIGKELITRNPDEAIVVVFDVSGSMGTKFFNEIEFTRLDATKEFFETFTDRNAGFDFSHVISLLLFSNTLKRACGFTENIVTFSSHVQNASSGGGTRLWDAIYAAIEYLNVFKQSYPNAHLRILCLSDGEDTSSNNNYTTIAKELVLKNITMDSIVVGALSQQLKAASFASGGYVFMPQTIQEGIKLFESENFLSVRARQVPTRVLVNSEADLIPLLSKDSSDNKPASAALPAQASAKTTSISGALKNIQSRPQPASSSKGGGSLKRLTKELSDLEANPHPNCSIFPTENDIYFWNVYMTGPDTTPYEGGTFHLMVEIPSDYPFKPPRVRFVTPVYHCNINKNGSICHAILKDQWSPALTIGRVFDCIFGLLLTPEPSDPLDAYIASEYRDNFQLFCQNAKEWTLKHASKTLQDILNEQKNQMPPQFLCGISGKIMTDPVIVVKSNNCYERSEILAVIQSTGKEPKTGEDINEGDLVTNVNLMVAIQEFNKSRIANP